MMSSSDQDMSECPFFGKFGRVVTRRRICELLFQIGAFAILLINLTINIAN